MQFFQWVVIHWQAVCGWSAGFYLLFRVGHVFTAIVLFINTVSARFKNAETSLQRVDSLVQEVANNHLAHIQIELEKINQTLDKVGEMLSGLREELAVVLREEISSN